jgi:hypothetical protein
MPGGAGDARAYFALNGVIKIQNYILLFVTLLEIIK